MATVHQKQWEFLKGKFEAGRHSHAYLLSGPEGIGKKAFAKEFIQLMSASVTGAEFAIENEQYPDLLIITSAHSESSVKNEKDMMEINVAQMRQVNQFLSYKSYYGGHKAVIIENAERMNTEAQNCFLKTLEEPKGNTVIFLLSSKPELLLPTIFSRCQVVTFLAKHQDQVATIQEQKVLQELLPIIRGELALKFQYTKKVNLEGNNLQNMLKVLQRYFRSMLLARLDVSSSLPQNSIVYDVPKLKNIIRLIEDLHRQLLTANINTRLALEVLLLEL
jgi:DNA polymerase-3 subunit delta'